MKKQNASQAEFTLRLNDVNAYMTLERFIKRLIRKMEPLNIVTITTKKNEFCLGRGMFLRLRISSKVNAERWISAAFHFEQTAYIEKSKLFCVAWSEQSHPIGWLLALREILEFCQNEKTQER